MPAVAFKQIDNNKWGRLLTQQMKHIACGSVVVDDDYWWRGCSMVGILVACFVVLF